MSKMKGRYGIIPASVTRTPGAPKTNWVLSLRSLGIPDATNGKAAALIGEEAGDPLDAVVQASDPSTGAIGRGTPPESEVTSVEEVTIVAAEAARQT